MVTSGNRVWFGNLRQAMWVTAPEPGMRFGALGSIETDVTANGGAFTSQSPATHQEFSMSWPQGPITDFRFLLDYRNGIYGTGLCYMVDPMWADENAFPAHMARPELSAKGWPSLYGASLQATLVDAVTATNLVANASSEVDVTGYTVIPGTTGVAAVAQAAVTNSAYSNDVARTTWTTATTAAGGGVYVDVPVTAGTIYSFAAYHVLSSITNRLQLNIEWRTASATISTTTGTQTVFTAGVAQTLTQLNLTAPATATIARMRIISVSGTSFAQWSIGSYLDVDALMAVVGATLPASGYFDGYTKFTDGRTGAWLGTAGLSQSTLAQIPQSGMPFRAAQYNITDAPNTEPARSTVMLIPPTTTLWMGFTGTATNGAVVRIQPIRTDGSYAPYQDATLLSATGTTRLNVSFSGATYSAVKVYFTSTALGSSLLSLVSAKAVYATTGSTPTLTGTHVDGRGSSGFRFQSDPVFSYTFYDPTGAAGVRKYASAAADFIEVGAWL